jgi:hypothetical protein
MRHSLAIVARLFYDDPLRLIPTLRTFKGTDFQPTEGMRRPSHQMRIAAAAATANRRNKFMVPLY